MDRVPGALLWLVAALLGVTGAVSDEAALVQSEVRLHVGAAGSEAVMHGRAGLLARIGRSMAGPKMPYNCTPNPWMCQEPFNCHLQSPLKIVQDMQTMATPDGHSNLQQWCADSTASHVQGLVKKCLKEKDLVASAKAVYEETLQGLHGTFTAEMDASYCFMEGHCTNTEVTVNTTVEEAEAMCDRRFGHDGWTKNFGIKDMLSLETVTAGMDNAKHEPDGFSNRHTPKIFLKAACAMGNFHCDVMYCRETYCKEEYYIKKYGYLLPRAPGHLIQQIDGPF